MCGKHPPTETTTSDSPGTPVSIPAHLPLYDAHCHPTDTPNLLLNLPTHRTTHLLAMSTRPSDQSLVSSLGSSPKVTPSFGLHPWFSHLISNTSPSTDTSPLPSPYTPTQLHYLSILSIPSPTPSDFRFISTLPTPIPLSTFLRSLRTHLTTHPSALLGEIGLDRSFRLPHPPTTTTTTTTITTTALTTGPRSNRPLSPYRISLPHQTTLLITQLHLAAEFHRPVSIHGVAAHGLLFTAISTLWKGHKLTTPNKKRRRALNLSRLVAPESDSDEDLPNEKEQKEKTLPLPYPPAICLHSFSGPPSVALQYLHPRTPIPIYFSFSTAVNLYGGPARASAAAAAEILASVLAVIPDDRVLAESDMDAVGPRMGEALEEIYIEICRIRGWDIEEGVTRINRNFHEFVNAR